MQLQTKEELSTQSETTTMESKINECIFSKDYLDFLIEAGCRLEKRHPSNSNNYSDLLEDTEWKSNCNNLGYTKHYRRDLDALS